MAHGTLTVPASSNPEVVVIVLATRDGVRLERCLRALADSGTGVRVQTVLSANAADVDVQEVIDAAHGAVVMRSDVNLGTAATWNRAVEAIDAQRFAIVHEDSGRGSGLASRASPCS